MQETGSGMAAQAAEELAALESAGLRRKLRSLTPSSAGAQVEWQGRPLLNFASNDYLGLSTREELKAAMAGAVEAYGVGSGASRLVCGNHPAHEELESTLAAFKGTEAALAFSSGYATALGTLPAVCGAGDVIILDKLCHASLIDAARLSGATIRVFPHNHLEKLERLLAGAHETGDTKKRVLVVTESIFSMDGDSAPLRKIVALKEQHDAWLMVDEAHAVGLLGPQGRGLIAALGLEKRVELQMGTLSKALGVSGGYLAAPRTVIDLLINKARSLIYSTAPPPALAATASAAIKLVQSPLGESLRQQLMKHRQQLLTRLGSDMPLAAAIIPLLIGDETAAMQTSAALLEAGYLIPAIRYPTVARGAARLRLTLSAAHEAGQIEGLVASLLHLMPQLSVGEKGALEEAAE